MTGSKGRRRACAARRGTFASSFQSRYLAHALKRKRAIAMRLSRRTKIGPMSRVQPRSVGQRWNTTFLRFAPTEASTRRAPASWRGSATNACTVSPAAIFLTISP
jgi:hypothetical protein